MDAAEFVVRLIDKATAPAKRISAAFAGIEKSLKPVTHNKAFKAIDKAGTKLWDFGKAAVLAGGAVGLGLAGAFTKAALDAAMFTENTKLAFTQLTHSAAGGEQAFSTVRGLVSGLGLDLHDTTDGMRKLLAAQFSLGQSTELLKMGADLSVIGIHGEEVARVLTAISQIKAKGKLQAEEMMQLAEAGISLTLVNGALQKSLGKTAAEVDKMKQAGQISGEIGIAAIQSAVKEKLGIENFGDARKKFINENLSGMIENLKSAGQLLFLKLGDSVLGAAKAMGPLVKDTIKWVETLDTSTITSVVTSVLETMRALIPVGREFLTGFVAGFGALADGMRVEIDATSLRAAADAGRSVAEAIGMIITVFKMAASALSFFTTPLGKVVIGIGLVAVAAVNVIAAVSAIAGAFATVSVAFAAVTGFVSTFLIPGLVILGNIIAAIGLTVSLVPLAIVAAFVAIGVAVFTWWDEIDAFFGGIPGKMLEFGKNMVMGLVNGITGAAGAVWDSLTGIGHTAIDATKSTLGIASPSKEFAKLGAFSAEGFAMGIDSKAPSIQSASSKSIASPSLQSASSKAIASPSLAGASSPTGGSGGGGINVPVTVNVSGGGNPQETARAVAEILPSAIVHALESLMNPSPMAA